MKKIIGLLCWAFGVAGVLAEDTNEAAIYKLLGEKGQEIKAHLAAYDKTTNFNEIGAAYSKLMMLHATNGAMWDAKLLVRVELLSRCLAGFDKTFDRTNVMWGHGARYGFNSVIPPSDPEARKKYDQWAAENERVGQRFNRNRVLKTWGEECRLMLELQLDGFVANGELDALAVITNAIARKIKDEPTRDQLLRRAQGSRKGSTGLGP